MNELNKNKVRYAWFCLLVMLITVSPVVSAGYLVRKPDKPFVKGLRRFIAGGWTRKDFPGATPEARRVLERHWEEVTIEGTPIVILSVRKAGPGQRRILYYYKDMQEGAATEAYVATVVRVSGPKPGYLLYSVTKSNFRLQVYLDHLAAAKLRAFKKLFRPIDPAALKFHADEALPVGVPKVRIPSALLGVIGEGTDSNASEYAVGMFSYGLDVRGYVVGTADCYDSPGTGLTLYTFVRHKGFFGTHWEWSTTSVRVRETTCGDAGEEWHVDGFIADVNGDRKPDVVTARMDSGENPVTGKAYPTSIQAEKCLYKAYGEFTCGRLSAKEYKRLVRVNRHSIE